MNLKNGLQYLLGATLLMSTPLALAKNDTHAQLKRFAQVYSAIQEKHLYEVSDADMSTHAISGMLNALDPHSEYIPANQFKTDNPADKEPHDVQIGIQTMYRKNSPMLIYEVLEDSPADKAGILPGDLIIQVNNKKVSALSEMAVSNLFRQHNNVKLTIFRPSTQIIIQENIERQVLQNHNITTKTLNNDILYVRIKAFEEDTIEAFVNKIVSINIERKGKAPSGLILDLRNNPGGIIQSGIGIASAFLPKNTLIVTLKERHQQKTFFNRPADYNFFGIDLLANLPSWIKTTPLIVLSNAASASASELVMGALQDHQRATIVGTQTFGKGSVQEIIPLRTGDAISLTVAIYFTPKNKTIQAQGIHPDIAISDTIEGNILMAQHEWYLPNHINPNQPNETSTPISQKTSKIHQFQLGGAHDFQLIQAQKILQNEFYLIGKPNTFLNMTPDYTY
ncbi:MAG: S41 family peptidase [Alcaligenaceae bacterium]|nr:S41 family peptidase [Alcaligenaceae bacterium]